MGKMFVASCFQIVLVVRRSGDGNGDSDEGAGDSGHGGGSDEERKGECDACKGGVTSHSLPLLAGQPVTDRQHLCNCRGMSG